MWNTKMYIMADPWLGLINNTIVVHVKKEGTSLTILWWFISKNIIMVWVLDLELGTVKKVQNKSVLKNYLFSNLFTRLNITVKMNPKEK